MQKNLFSKGLLTCTTLLFAVAVTGCQTMADKQRDKENRQTESEPKESQTKRNTTNVALTHLRGLEIAFLKNNCADALEHGSKLEAMKIQEQWTHFAQLAFRVCAAEIDPKNKEKAKAALAAIANLEKEVPRPFHSAYLEKLKAARYLALGDKENAFKAKKRERDILHEHVHELLQIDFQLLELSASTAGLSPGEFARFKEVGQLAMRDDKLFEALRILDALIPEIKNKEALEIVKEQRAYIVARIEQLFSLDAAILESKRLTDEAEAKSIAASMRQKYPTGNYEARIAYIMSGVAQTQPKAQATPVPSGEETPLPEQMSDDAKVERALTDARTELDSGNPGRAVDILDTLPDAIRTDKTKRMRRDAMEVHVRDLRARVRDLYTRTKSQTSNESKLETLEQCKQILEQILSRYPETSVKNAVERNLKSIQDEIVDLRKAPK